jgi:hypothetical protein
MFTVPGMDTVASIRMTILQKTVIYLHNKRLAITALLEEISCINALHGISSANTD